MFPPRALPYLLADSPLLCRARGGIIASGVLVWIEPSYRGLLHMNTHNYGLLGPSGRPSFLFLSPPRACLMFVRIFQFRTRLYRDTATLSYVRQD